MPSAYLEITTPQGKKRFALGPKPVTIGRHADNRLVLADNMASRFHCVIEPSGDRWIIRDLNASNGTLLDGRRITEAPVNPGDVVLIGSTEIVLVDPSRPAPPKPAARRPPTEDVVELGGDVEITDEMIDEEPVDVLTEDDV